MNRIVRLLLCWLALLCACALPADAASPYGWVRTSDGRPVAWNNSQPIPYSVDQGPLGRLSNADATALVQAAFQRWAGVDTALISFAPAAPLAQDITGANALAFLNSLPAGVNPIIFDTDGQVMKMLLGDPAAAVALGRPLTVDPTGSTITSGFVVLNGLYIDGRFNPDDLSLDDYRGMVVQEIGRFLGLGYSQLNTELILDGMSSNNTLIPQMYPVPVPGNADQLTTDDRAALAARYPNPANSSTGTIRGQVLLPDGTTGLQGINVIARRMGDPSVTAVSAISGMRFKNEIGPPGLDGSRQPALRGAYELSGLPPGMYTLTLEALRPESMAGPLRHPAFLPGGTQFYRAGGAATTDPAMAGTIAVSAGQAVENVNVVVAAPAGPPLQEITATEPNEFPEQAQTLPPSVRVHGSIQPGDASAVSVPLSGGGVPSGSAAVQDLYRLNITQPAIVTATLSAATAGANLDLFLLTGPVTTAPQVVAASTDPGTPPQTFQLRLSAGIYFLGVSLVSGPGTTYTLDVNSTPAPDSTAPAPPKPVLSNLVVGNITANGADTDFASDLPSNTIYYVSNPLTEFSNPTVATDHRQSFTGLAAGAPYRLRTMALTPGGTRGAGPGLGTLPDAFFTTASPALPGGVGQISAGIVDTIDDPNDPNAEYVVIGLRNVGTGDASSVTISTLTPPPGWAFSTPPGTPVNFGFIGRGGSGLLMTRVQRTAGTAGVGRAYIASHASPIISGTGTYFSPGVGQQTFTFGSVMPSLILSKSASPATARPGDVVTFTLTATNQGMGPSTGVLISDALPAGMTFVPSSGGGQFQNGAVFWNLGTLAPNSSQTVTFQAMVNAGTASGTTITNVALLRSNENPNSIASNVVPVSVSAPPPPPPPQLLLSKSADRSTVQPGQTITYTLSYTNAGPSPASHVLLTDPLPAGTTLAGAPGGVLTTSGGAPAVVWAIGPLAAGSGGSRTLQLTVAPNTPGGTSITNTAQIMATEAPAPVTASAAPVQVTAQPQIVIVKSADRSQVRPGDLITYTVTVSNPGAGPATNVQLSDPIPAGTSFSGFADLFSSSGTVQNGTVVWNLGTLGVNANATVSFRVQAAAGSAGPINNVAQVTSAEIQTPVQSNNVSISVMAPPPPPQLQLTKSADHSTVQPGQTVRYSLTVSNIGAGPASNVQISDAIPGGTSYVPGSADNNGGPIDASTVGWTLSALQPGGSLTVSFQAQVTATSGTINNVGQVTSAEVPTPVPSNQGNPVVVTVVSQPQLQIQKSVIGPATAAPGSLITYQLSFTNAFGGGMATNVTIQDLLPMNTTFVNPSNGGFISGVTAIWNIGTLQPGQSGSVTLQVRVNPGVPNGTPITNTAQINSAELQSPVASNAVTVTVLAPPPPPQLSLLKQEDVTSVQPNGTVNYQLTVTNSGGPASNVTISDTIPAGMTGIVALDGGVITPGGFGSPAVATWNLGTLGSGGSRLVRLQVQVNGNASGTITNVAQVMSVEAPTPVNSNPASVTVNVPPPPPNLSIQKVLSPPKPTAAPGDTLQYLISFQNNGSSAVTATVVDPIPANTQLVAVSQGASAGNGAVSWNLGALGPGQSGQVILQVKVLPGTPDQTPINNQAQITVPSQQYAQNSNVVTTTVVVPPPPLNLTVQKSVDKSTAAPGETLTYTLTYRNNGAGPVSGAAVVDPIPANTQFAGAPGATLANGVLTWALPSPLNPGQGGQLTLRATILPGTPDQTAITNTAQITVTAQQYSQSSGTVTTTVLTPPSLTLSKSVDKPTAIPGDTLTYTLSFANTGAQAANQVVILDQLPPGVTFGSTPSNTGQLVSATPPNTGLFVRFNLGSVASGASGSVQFTAQINNNVSPGTSISNQATISAAGLPQPVVSNAATTMVTAAPLNLTIQKALSPAKPTAAPGDLLQYVLTFQNNGPATVTGAAITDSIPANTQFVGASPGFTSANGIITWNLGSLGPNKGGQFLLQVRVLSGTPDQTVISNTAHIVVAARQYSQDSSAVTTTVVVPPPPLNLVVQKSVDKPMAAPGDMLLYTITYKNNGAGMVTGAAITDTIPANTQLPSPPPGATVSNGVITWPLGSLSPNQSGQVSFQAQILTGTPGQTPINNQAQITVAARQYVQNSGTVTTIVTLPPPPLNLVVQKAVDKQTAAPGDTLQYTITYKNNGAGAVSGAAVVDPIPANTQATFASPGFHLANNTLTWPLPNPLNPGQGGQLTLRVMILPGTPDQTVISNTAQITVAAQQYSQSSGAATTTVMTPPPTGLTLSKSVDKMTAAAGDTLTYTLTYANSGPQVIHQVAITDPLPAGVTFAGSPDGGQLSGGAVQFTIGDLSSGASGHVSFQVTVNAGVPNGTMITNQGRVSAQGIAQAIPSNSVSTTVGTAVTSFAGTWVSAPPAGDAVSLTVDPQNHLTVWAISADRRSIVQAVQGKLNPDGSFSTMITNTQVLITVQIAADRQSAKISASAARPGFPSFSVTAPRVPDVGPLPSALVGTFNGFTAAANGDRLLVRLSIDPGGNSTFEGEVTQTTPAGLRVLYAHYYVTADGRLTDPANNGEVGILQVQNNKLVLMYTFQQSGTPPYQNTFQVQLQPLTP